MPASPIRKLAPFAAAAKDRGTHIYHLNIGQPDLKTPPQFLQAINEGLHGGVVAYAPSEGYPTYREKLAASYTKIGADIDPDDIIVTSGGSEALIFTVLSCFDPGDELIVPEPFYANYAGFSRMSDTTLVPLTTHIESGYALPPIEAFEKVITPKTRGIILNNPSNPTGKVFEREALEKLERLVQKHDLFLIADEVYKEFVYDGKEFISTLALPSIQQNVVMIDSISKKWSACGARLGNLVTKNKELRATALKFAQARLSPPSMAQLGAAALLDLPESYYEDVRAEYLKRRDLVVERLRAMPGVLCPKSAGAFYLFPQFPVDDTEKFCQWLLDDFAHNGETVMMAPGAGFYVNAEQGKQQARIAYVLNTDHLSRAMDVLAAGLEAYPGRTC
jgi:aspartate aminotransferase